MWDQTQNETVDRDFCNKTFSIFNMIEMTNIYEHFMTESDSYHYWYLLIRNSDGFWRFHLSVPIDLLSLELFRPDYLQLPNAVPLNDSFVNAEKNEKKL